MAESWRAKAKRYARGDFTNAELKILLGGMVADQVIDIATYGRLSQLKGKAFVRVALPLVKRAGMMAGRGMVSTAGTGLGVGRLVMRNPYVLGATAIYVGVTERERIKQLLDQGYEIVREEVVDPVLQQTAPGRQELFETMQPQPAPFIPGVIEQFRPKRRPSAFNKAVKAGMLAVKRSTSYGKKGTISPAKKAFTLVTKLASAKKKKKKAPKSGIRRKIWNAMKGLR